ncbi:MAG: trypsin-like peptidase domain-containing protein [Pirellulaceae bacterium]
MLNNANDGDFLNSEELQPTSNSPSPSSPSDPPVESLVRAERGPSLSGQVFWIFCCGAFVIGLWQLGPIVAERYQYSVSRGKAMAEYEVAKLALRETPLTSVSFAYQMVAQKIKPSVVSVDCKKPDGHGQGSGVIISEDGYIVTNRHVIEDSSFIRVTLHDRHEYEAKLVGEDDETDLAVLKINAQGLIPAEWGNSQELAVGSIVWAIGSPFGFTQTVTSGIVSGKNRLTFDEKTRSFRTFQELIQTDAAVNPGNSGGPLVDANGRVIGINTSILGESYMGISFAVPSAVAEFVSGQIRKNGQVQRGFLGFIPAIIRQEKVSALKLNDLNGALVNRVTPNSPAERAGLQVNDVIRSWNGEPVHDYNQVYNLIGVTPPDKNVRMEILRDGQPLTLEVTVTARPQDLRSR